jgi:hypothetical protein
MAVLIMIPTDKIARQYVLPKYIAKILSEYSLRSQLPRILGLAKVRLCEV